MPPAFLSKSVFTVGFACIAFVSGCGHGSVSNGSGAAQHGFLPPQIPQQSAARHTFGTTQTAPMQTAPVLRITNLDAGVTADASPDKTLSVVNGSRLQLFVSAPDVKSGSVHVGDGEAALTSAGDGQWTATMRYVDSSNPPKQHPILEVDLSAVSGTRVLRIPIDEQHQ